MTFPSRRLLLIAAAGLALSACGQGAEKAAGSDSNRLVVAATAVPHAEILEAIKPTLAEQGLEIEIKVFNDYVQPNLVVQQGQADVNYFQTRPHLDEFNRERGGDLTIVTGVHVEPFGAYSRKHRALADLPRGAVVALPSEPSNTGRALVLLNKAGVIGLKDPTDALSTVRDVVSNPKGLVFRELEAATLPRVLDQVDLALINTNYALTAGLNPSRDALAREGADSPYVNYLVARAGRVSDANVQKLAAALKSPQVRTFIEQKYQGAVIPAF